MNYEVSVWFCNCLKSVLETVKVQDIGQEHEPGIALGRDWVLNFWAGEGGSQTQHSGPNERWKVGVPGWISWLSIRLWLRSWSHSSRVRARFRALCWQLRAWSLLQILCASLFLHLPLSCSLPFSLSLYLSLSKINIKKKKRKVKWSTPFNVIPRGLQSQSSEIRQLISG